MRKTGNRRKQACALCGEPIDRGTRGNRRYCERCGAELRRQRKREWLARKSGESAEWLLRPPRSGHEEAAAAIAAQATREGMSYGRYVCRKWAKEHARLEKPAWVRENTETKGEKTT